LSVSPSARRMKILMFRFDQTARQLSFSDELWSMLTDWVARNPAPLSSQLWEKKCPPIGLPGIMFTSFRCSVRRLGRTGGCSGAAVQPHATLVLKVIDRLENAAS
jgi:hypothetical protein